MLAFEFDRPFAFLPRKHLVQYAPLDAAVIALAAQRLRQPSAQLHALELLAADFAQRMQGNAVDRYRDRFLYSADTFWPKALVDDDRGGLAERGLKVKEHVTRNDPNIGLAAIFPGHLALIAALVEMAALLRFAVLAAVLLLAAGFVDRSRVLLCELRRRYVEAHRRPGACGIAR